MFSVVCFINKNPWRQFALFQNVCAVNILSSISTASREKSSFGLCFLLWYCIVNSKIRANGEMHTNTACSLHVAGFMEFFLLVLSCF